MIYILSLLFLIIGAALIYLANLEGKFEVRTSHIYDENINTIFNKLRDFKSWKEWSPWLIHEPDCELEFSETPSEENGFYTWNGQIVGAGKLTHLNFSAPNLIEQKLDILKPFKNSADIRFELKEHGDKTEVTWIMNSQMPFLFRFMVPKMKQMIGQDYKLGLAMLAGALNQNAEHPEIEFIGESIHDEQSFLCKHFEGHLDDMTKAMEKGFPELLNYVQENNGTIAGAPRAFYHKADIDKMYFICDMAIPISGDLEKGPYTIKPLGTGKHYQIDAQGSYEFLESAWYAAMAHIYMSKLKLDKSRPSVEVYVNDPNEVAHSNEIKTSLLVPLK